jgi:molybdopterin-guanine dinucleotide biosynthesis protein A
MGFDKARMRIGGRPLAAHLADLLSRVASVCLEVGPGASGLPCVAEREPGSGPLAAIADGVTALRAAGAHGSALILATDLPALDIATLTRLARWPGVGSVVPTLEGRAQPLCARWCAADLDACAALVAAGARSLAPLLARPGVELTDALDPSRLRDADTPDDLAALGLDWSAP